MPRILFVLPLISALALSGCWEGISRAVLATVLSSRGEVVFSSKESGKFGLVGLETKLGEGSVLRTSSGALVDLFLVPGALAQVSGNSEMKIEELNLTKDGNETGNAIRDRVARMELRRGTIVVLFEGVSNFTIETREATIRVLPSCLLRVDVNEREVRATCVRGKVYATPKNGQVVAIDGGFFREWPSPRGAVATTEDRRSQKDTTEALQISRELGDFQESRRDRLPF